MDIVQDIKERREALNLTQKQLGKMVGVTGSNISQIENKNYEKLKVGTLLKLANIFNMDVIDFFRDNNKEAEELGIHPKYLEALKLIFKVKNETDREEILELLKNHLEIKLKNSK